MKKRYHTVNGMLIGETSNGVRRGYLPDALGSVVATVDDNGAIENTYRYKPYGGLLAKTGTAADPRFMWVGARGYRSTSTRSSELYVRKRHYASTNGAWTSVDPLWPVLEAYSYVSAKVATLVDPTGLAACGPPCCEQAMKDALTTGCEDLDGERGIWKKCDPKSVYGQLLTTCDAGGGNCNELIARLWQVVKGCNRYCGMKDVPPAPGGGGKPCAIEPKPAACTVCCSDRGTVRNCGTLCCEVKGKTFLDLDPYIAGCLALHEKTHGDQCSTNWNSGSGGANFSAYLECKAWYKEAKCLRDILRKRGCSLPAGLNKAWLDCQAGGGGK